MIEKIYMVIYDSRKMWVVIQVARGRILMFIFQLLIFIEDDGVGLAVLQSMLVKNFYVVYVFFLFRVYVEV